MLWLGLACIAVCGFGAWMLTRHIRAPIFFSESLYHKFPRSIEDVNFGFDEGDCAVGITKLSHAEELVGESVHDEATVSAWWELWEWHFGFANGCDNITIGNGDLCWWFIVVECGVGSSAMEVVMGGSHIGDGCEVCIVVYLWLYWTTIVVVADLWLMWATGVISGVY